MDEERPQAKKRCKAMIDADIIDPDSHEGIVFCTDECPYSYCVVFETEKIMSSVPRRQLAKELYAAGIARYDIALIIGVTLRTVERYLKK